MSHVISTRLQDDLYFSLTDIAETRKRKLSDIFQEAIHSYIQDHVDYQIALDRLNDHTDEVIDEGEMRARLGWVDAL